MITEIVSFKVTPGMSRDDVLEDARSTLDRWRGFPGLVRKTFLMGENDRCVGVYLWESKDHALQGHDAVWLDRAEARWGNRPDIRYFDTLMELNNGAGEVTEYPADTP